MHTYLYFNYACEFRIILIVLVWTVEEDLMLGVQL